jgi:hypothetical protein
MSPVHTLGFWFRPFSSGLLFAKYDSTYWIRKSIMYDIGTEQITVSLEGNDYESNTTALVTANEWNYLVICFQFFQKF